MTVSIEKICRIACIYPFDVVYEPNDDGLQFAVNETHR